VLAKASDDSPMVAMKELGDGAIVYYGIFDGKSEFKNSPGYPIFWNGLVSFLMGVEDINNFNFNTGKLLAFTNSKTIITPKGKVKTEKHILDTIGIYSVDSEVYAVNLFDAGESNTWVEPSIKSIESDKYKAEKIEREKDVSLELYLIILAAIVLFIEMVYLKFRGDA